MLADVVSPATKERAAELVKKRLEVSKVPIFADFARARSKRAQEIAKDCTEKLAIEEVLKGAPPIPVFARAGLAFLFALLVALTSDLAFGKLQTASPTDPLAEVGLIEILQRLFSADLLRGWTTSGFPPLSLK